MTFPRTLAAALAIAALAVPAAQAEPAGSGANPTSGATAGGQYTPGATPLHPATRTRLAGPPTWPTNPQPVVPARAVESADGSGIATPAAIALGIAGSLLVVVGLVGVTRRGRRVRARVAA
jgi:hypothetical protein